MIVQIDLSAIRSAYGENITVDPPVRIFVNGDNTGFWAAFDGRTFNIPVPIDIQNLAGATSPSPLPVMTQGSKDQLLLGAFNFTKPH